MARESTVSTEGSLPPSYEKSGPPMETHEKLEHDPEVVRAEELYRRRYRLLPGSLPRINFTAVFPPSTLGQAHAQLRLSVKNVPRLLRLGLQWSPDCIHVVGSTPIEKFSCHAGVSRDYICPGKGSTDEGWGYKKVYHVSDGRPDPQWCGYLIVYAANSSVLEDPPLYRLCQSSIVRVTATFKDNVIYRVDRNKGTYLNYIYPDRVMPGEEPWIWWGHEHDTRKKGIAKMMKKVKVHLCF